MPLTIMNSLKLSTGIRLLRDTWITVQLPYQYEQMIVVATPIYDADETGAVVRIRNAGSGSTFQMRLENPSGNLTGTYQVSYVVVEEGVYEDAASGTKIEAHLVSSTIVDNKNSWVGQSFTTTHNYNDAVVLGQVMTNNAAWSTFWAFTPNGASANQIGIGRHTGADFSTRAAETLGILVFEAGSGEINGIQFEAGNTTESITGRGTQYAQSVSFPALTAIASSNGMNGADGGWPVLWGANETAPFANDSLTFIIDEDQVEDTEQTHATAESFGYLALNSVNATSRFLIQAGFGGSMEYLEEVSRTGIANWLEEQKNPEVSLTQPHFDDIEALIPIAPDGTRRNFFPFHYADFGRIHAENMSTAWIRKVIHGEDQFRQRMTWTLSQIFVVAYQDKHVNRYMGDVYANYHDMLSANTFGNFRDILEAVTIHPMMGYYLTYMANAKASEDGLVQPDENYAREIMQLFTIGLWDLNMDGTRKLDASGEPIPTYDLTDISELSRVFTGFTVTRDDGRNNLDIPGIAPGTVRSYMQRHCGTTGVPGEMVMHDNHHDTEAKTVFHGKPWEESFPSRAENGSGLADITQALDMLFNHPNTAPFISKALIQFLVTSNPTAAYIERVANVFVDNGEGVRGDLFAVFKAILLDENARQYALGEEQIRYGKLIEPLVRFTRLLKAFKVGEDLPPDDFSDINNPKYNDVYWVSGGFGGQTPSYSPSVFNFFQPDFEPGNPLIKENGERMVAPEMQIYDSASATLQANEVLELLKNGSGVGLQNADRPFHGDAPSAPFQWSTELAMVDDVDALITRLDTLLCGGLMRERSRNVLTHALTRSSDAGLHAEDRLITAIYGTFISPDCTILV